MLPVFLFFLWISVPQEDRNLRVSFACLEVCLVPVLSLIIEHPGGESRTDNCFAHYFKDPASRPLLLRRWPLACSLSLVLYCFTVVCSHVGLAFTIASWVFVRLFNQRIPVFLTKNP